ncbi:MULTISPECIES: amidase [unclassified Streptomyces]|uniref:amidase n=1 Tax=unclassified Streptomyces TaxID=2593676 RepID=UPI00081B27C5|nr:MULTISPECIES: amidase [unclassified Streptomyces]MYQ89588.1 amidase [Streptomyces sp. SID4936]SCE58911.1 amidase [Streptomyces sp. DvalAA-43]
MTELHDLTALQLAAAYRRGETGPVDVVEHLLARIGDGDRVGAFTTVSADRARAAAAGAERALRSADRAGLPRLFGVPTAVKDLEATAGVRTTLGSALFRDWIPGHDDEIVEVMADAGLISLGKTTVPEFGAACYTEPEVSAPARSPFDLDRSAAGSSGGAAAAVGALLVPIAQGSDTAGSVRSPASACGVVGLKTSRGLITAGPDGNDGMGLSVRGPLARTVRDTAAFLDALTTRTGVGTVHPPRVDSYERACDAPVPRLRIALAQGSVSGAPVDPEVAAASELTARTLAGLGHEVFIRDQAPDPEFTESFQVMFTALVGSRTVAFDGASLRPIVRHLRSRSQEFTSGELAAAIGVVQARARAWTLGHADADLVITPTVTTPPTLVGQLRDDADPAAELAAMTAFTGNTILANATGFPAISLPLGWSSRGLPLGVSLTAGWGREDLLLGVSAALEEALPWAHRYGDRAEARTP